ncbi:hypothetical protein [Novosphingobium sp. RL4]|uniref:hypothetical protein n=1 Tax=Novosphingobium sp. RL4 TaxID=3109595 RepID=UPI002D79A334|nr:hypothetical protein [Novosphingobium sp. RL4]WRT91870.1 hypothetical protein U9J33_11675 [Novosphingobium sp. RL4]
MTPHSIARWPAMMGRKTAMEYLDVGETAFEREIAAGRIPEGIMFGGKPHWRRDALDKALAVISGEMVTDHIARFEERRRGKAA